MIDPRDIAIVFQGRLPMPDTLGGRNLQRTIARLRLLLPHAPVYLGTWEGCPHAGSYGFDSVVMSADPGALPCCRRTGPAQPNNVNRQLAGAQAVLGCVERRYTLKLRLDCDVASTHFLDLYAAHGRSSGGNERIAVAGFSTLDPRMFEHMPFHVSDWFALGPTEKVRALWSAPLMTAAGATHYDRHPHAAGSGYFDRRYRARFAIEQHIAGHYAARLGYATPRFHNDASAGVLAAHDRFIAHELLLLDVPGCGIALPVCEQSSLHHFGCLSFLDWYRESQRHDPARDADPALLGAATRRHAIKRRVRLAARLAEPWMPLLAAAPFKAGVSSMLRRAASADRACGVAP